MMPYHGDLMQILLNNMELGHAYTTPELCNIVWPGMPSYQAQITHSDVNKKLHKAQSAGFVDGTKIRSKKGGKVCVWWLV